MHIVFFSHPEFLNHQSMPRFSRMLANGMNERGHKVEVLFPKPFFFHLPVPALFKKWMGYLDQYVVFPRKVRKRLSVYPPDTLFVFNDHALGPWVPLVANRPHIIHCHDFLAQRSALGEIKENRTGWSGRQYQNYIRHGYSKGKNFISGSQNTKHDLHHFLSLTPNISEVVYNGLNQNFTPQNLPESREALSKKIGIDLTKGFLLHVGGNLWYKNRPGVIELYNAWRSLKGANLPILLIGEAPNRKLLQMHAKSPFKVDIHFLSGIEDKYVRLAYAGASVFLFPSLAEGFGWPVAEAMASGCPVITTKEAPMTEVAGHAGFYIPRSPFNEVELKVWATESAKVVDSVLKLSTEERSYVVEAGIVNAKRFNTEFTLDKIEAIYHKVLKAYFNT